MPSDIYEMFNNKLDELIHISNIEISPSHNVSKVMLRNHLSAIHWNLMLTALKTLIAHQGKFVVLSNS